MNGAQFLAQVRRAPPDTTRMLLTGYRDLNAAMDAVNEGNIFRFLMKPCEKEVVGKATTTGLVHPASQVGMDLATVTLPVVWTQEPNQWFAISMPPVFLRLR